MLGRGNFTVVGRASGRPFGSARTRWRRQQRARSHARGGAETPIRLSAEPASAFGPTRWCAEDLTEGPWRPLRLLFIAPGSGHQTQEIDDGATCPQ